MIEELEIILETTSKILQKHVNHSLRQNIVSENTDILNLWNEIEKNGLPKISVKEKFGGYEIPFFSILPLIKIVNNHGTPLPLSETILSNYILSESDINAPNGIVTFATNTKNLQIKNNMISGEILSVPYLNLTKNLLIVHEFNNVKKAILIDEINGEIIHKKNFLAEPRYDIKVENLNIAEMKPIKNNIDFNFLGAILRSAQMIGAMEKVVDLSINYCSERKQFGRTLSKFQAIQHQISEMAVELSASSAALSTITELGLGEKNSNDTAILKIRAGFAAGKIIALLIVHEFNNVKKAILIDEINGEIIHKKNFLAEPRYDIKVENLNIAEMKPIKNNIDFNFLGAILRSAQMIGAMEKVVDLSINYCSERKQFGRTLSKFQAIQHQISEMAVELSASSAALSTITELGLGEKNSNDTAILKIRAGFAAGKIIAISHQVHGAIGFTKEYELSYFTKNLNSWRNDFGNESFWEEFLGKRFLEKNNKNLWEYLT